MPKFLEREVSPGKRFRVLELAVESLGQCERERRVLLPGDDADKGVGSDLQGGKSRCDDESACEKSLIQKKLETQRDAWSFK